MSELSRSDDDLLRQIERRTAAALEKIPGVRTADVRLEGIRRVHAVLVEGEGTASPIAITPMVHEVLRRTGLEFSPGAVRVDAPASARETPRDARRFLVLDALETTRADHRATCRVRLRRLDKSFDGEARDLDTVTGRARAAARAVLHAAELAVPGACLALEGAQIVDLFGRRHVVVAIEAVNQRRTSRLPGIAALENAPEDAACLATLGAIDRWLAG